MSLTGTSFFALAVILVLAVPAVMVLTWNRVPGPGPVRIAARVGMTILSQAAAVLVVLVWVNNSYGLYDPGPHGFRQPPQRHGRTRERR
jgi:hypothetical protein